MIFNNLDFDKIDYDSGSVGRSFSHLIKPWEYIVTPDHFGCWKRHVAWAKSDGRILREHVTQQFSSNMVFMSLLLNGELSILFNSANVPTSIRQHLSMASAYKLEFWVGLFILLSVFVTLFAILATFTAWGMVSSLSNENAICVLRSSIGQYTTQLPSRLVAASLFLFLSWTSLFLFILLPRYLAAVVMGLILSLYLHVVSVYSAFGRMLMHSGAMGDRPIFDSSEEASLLPAELQSRLSERAGDALKRRTSVTAQYKNHPFQKNFRRAIMMKARTATSNGNMSDGVNRVGGDEVISGCSAISGQGTCPATGYSSSEFKTLADTPLTFSIQQHQHQPEMSERVPTALDLLSIDTAIPANREFVGSGLPPLPPALINTAEGTRSGDSIGRRYTNGNDVHLSRRSSQTSSVSFGAFPNGSKDESDEEVRDEYIVGEQFCPLLNASSEKIYTKYRHRRSLSWDTASLASILEEVSADFEQRTLSPFSAMDEPISFPFDVSIRHGPTEDDGRPSHRNTGSGHKPSCDFAFTAENRDANNADHRARRTSTAIKKYSQLACSPPRLPRKHVRLDASPQSGFAWIEKNEGDNAARSTVTEDASELNVNTACIKHASSHDTNGEHCRLLPVYDTLRYL